MLLTLGLDSQFTMASTFKTEQSDFSMDQTGWDPDHGNVWRVSLASSSPMVGCRWNLFCRISSRPAHVPPGWLLFSLLNIETQGGYFIFVLMDWYSGSWSLIFLAVLEVILVAWVSSITWMDKSYLMSKVKFSSKCKIFNSYETFVPVFMKKMQVYFQVYGVQRLRRDIHHMGIKTSRWFTVLVTHLDETNFRIVAAYWEVTWRFACPFLLFSVMVASLVNLQK